MAAINVKVPTKSVLASLKSKLTELKKQVVENEKWSKEHIAATEAYNEKVEKFRPKVAPAKVHIHTGWRWSQDDDTTEVTLTYNVPRKLLPLQPKEPDYHTNVNDNVIGELESAIRILSMTEEQFVGASTFKAVTKFL